MTDVKHGQAFTLVELSIVLVILGLLIGGVLTGQALIRASELRAVSTEISRYSAATYTFRDKYMALPGDMTNATSYWGKDNTNCSGNTGTAATPGTCNGNGDGVMSNPSVASGTGETFQYWKQLALAGLIEGTYSGIAATGGPRGAAMGINIPRSKLSQGAIGIEHWGTVVSNPVLYDGTYNNIYIFGRGDGAAAANPPEQIVMKPEEAYNIDKKMDDGKALYGNIRPFYRNGYDSKVCADVAGEYNLSFNAIQCNLVVITGF